MPPASGEPADKRVDLAIQMSNVTIRICWDSTKEQFPDMPPESRRELFIQRLGHRSVPSLMSDR